MKIVVNARFLLPGVLEGIGRFSHEVLRQLVLQHPKDQFYFLFDRPYDQQFIYAKNVTPIVVYPPARHPILYFFWFQVMVPRILRQLKPDVFFSPDNMTTLHTAVPKVTIFHDVSYLHFPEEKKYFDLRYYQKNTPKFAAASKIILTVSEFTKQDLLASFPVNPAQVKVIHAGVSDFFKPIRFEEQINTRLKFVNGEMYFLFVGALQPRKNLVNILAAFDAFKQYTRSEVKLVMVGRKAWKSGPIMKAYKRMVYKADVVFTGQVSNQELRNLYGSALGLLFISVFEGFGLPILEAQKCDCPVITSNTSSMPEVAAGSAVFVDPSSPDDICAAMVQLYHYPEKREKLIQKGRKNWPRYTWARTAELVYEGIREAAVV